MDCSIGLCGLGVGGLESSGNDSHEIGKSVCDSVSCEQDFAASGESEVVSVSCVGSSCSSGGVQLREPAELISAVMRCGVDVSSAVGLVKDYYAAQGSQVAAIPTVSSVSARSSKRTARVQRWRQEVAALPERDGQCYLNMFKWGLRHWYLREFKTEPKLSELVAFMKSDHLDVWSLDNMKFYRIGDGMGNSLVYHVSDHYDAGELVGTVRQVLSSFVRAYPFVNPTLVVPCEDRLVLPLVGRVGLRQAETPPVVAGPLAGAAQAVATVSTSSVVFADLWADHSDDGLTHAEPVPSDDDRARVGGVVSGTHDSTVGQCYLRILKHEYQSDYAGRFGMHPALADFVSYLRWEQLDIDALDLLHVFRSHVPGFPDNYHIAEAGAYDEPFGTVRQFFKRYLFLYPTVNRVLVLDGDVTSTFISYNSRIGGFVEPSILGSEVTVLHAPLSESALRGVRDSDLSTPGGFNISDVSASDVTASGSQVSVSSGSSGGTIRVTHQQLSYGRLDSTIRSHLRSSTDSQVLVVPQVLSSVPLVHPDSYIMEPLRAEISIVTVRGDVHVAAAGYRFHMDPTVMMVLPSGVGLEILRGKTAEINVQAIVAQVSVWWQRLFKPSDVFSNQLLPVGFNGVLSIGSFEYGWFDCAAAMSSQECAKVTPLLIKEVPGRQFTVGGITVKSPVTGRFGVDVVSGAVSVGGVMICTGQSYYAIGVQHQVSTVVDAVGHSSNLHVYGPAMDGLNVRVSYMLRNI